MTGVFNLHSRTTGKRLEALRELVPTATKFAFLTGPGKLLAKNEAGEAQSAAQSLGIELIVVNAQRPEEVEAAFKAAIRESAHGMIFGSDGTFFDPTAIIAGMASSNLPTICVYDRFVRSGGLISYGTDEAANYRLLGTYVGRVLRGDKPADIPVQQAIKTKLVINLKTAKTMGVTVPTSLLLRADEVIE